MTADLERVSETIANIDMDGPEPMTDKFSGDPLLKYFLLVSSNIMGIFKGCNDPAHAAPETISQTIAQVPGGDSMTLCDPKCSADSTSAPDSQVSEHFAEPEDTRELDEFEESSNFRREYCPEFLAVTFLEACLGVVRMGPIKWVNRTQFLSTTTFLCQFPGLTLVHPCE